MINHKFRSECLDVSYLGVKIRDSGHVQLAIYTVLDEEFESEVNNLKFKQLEVKNRKKLSSSTRGTGIKLLQAPAD